MSSPNAERPPEGPLNGKEVTMTNKKTIKRPQVCQGPGGDWPVPVRGVSLRRISLAARKQSDAYCARLTL